MRRESWVRSAAVVALVVGITACTGGEETVETTTTAAPTTTTAPVTTTTEAPTTTTTEPPTTTAPPSDQVGSEEALQELVDEALGFADLFFPDADLTVVPIPDVTSPNAVDALRGLLDFDLWIASTAPVRQWADVMAFPESPAYGRYRRSLDALDNNKLVVRLQAGDYVVETVEVLDDLQSGVPEDVVSSAPEGSVALRYLSSSPAYDYIDQSGEVVQTDQGWQNRPRTVLLSPTDSGWKFFWFEDV